MKREKTTFPKCGIPASVQIETLPLSIMEKLPLNQIRIGVNVLRLVVGAESRKKCTGPEFRDISGVPWPGFSDGNI